MIRREQVADLRPGDVVRVDFGDGSYLQGPLRAGRLAELLLSPFLRLRRTDGDCYLADGYTLTVISRAPRPLYVNHDRTEPVPGDVACDDEVRGDPALVWSYLGMDRSDGTWFDRWGYGITRSDLADRLRLLVDGETGQVVP